MKNPLCMIGWHDWLYPEMNARRICGRYFCRLRQEYELQKWVSVGNRYIKHI